MAFPKHAHTTEKRIITAILRRALKADYLVSVYDGEEWALKFSSDFEAITAEVHATDTTTLVFRDANNADKAKVGSVWLVHGNEDDVIANHSDNEAMEALVKGL